MQDAGDSPPTCTDSEGRKRRNFSAPRRIRPKPGTASDRRTPRSRCGVSEQRLTQRFAPRNRRRGLLWWIAPVELRGGAENRNGQEQVQKKTAKKSRSYGGVEFSGGGFGSHPYWLDKTVVVLSPIAGPGISLIASSGSRNGLYGKLRLWFRLRVTTSLVRSALRLLVSTPSGCPGFGPGFQPLDSFGPRPRDYSAGCSCAGASAAGAPSPRFAASLASFSALRFASASSRAICVGPLASVCAMSSLSILT